MHKNRTFKSVCAIAVSALLVMQNLSPAVSVLADEIKDNDETNGTTIVSVAEPTVAPAESEEVVVVPADETEETVEFLLPLTALGGVGASLQEGFLQEQCHGGCLGIDVVLVPAQLQIVGLVGAHAVAVAEGYIPHAVAGHLAPHVLYILCLTAAVGAVDGCYLHSPFTLSLFLLIKSFHPW